MRSPRVFGYGADRNEIT